MENARADDGWPNGLFRRSKLSRDGELRV